MNLGERIRTAREAAGLSQRALADLVHVDQRTIGNWERGKALPRSTLGALEHALGVTLRGSPPRDTPRIDEATDAQLVSEFTGRLAERTRTIHELRLQVAALQARLVELGHPTNDNNLDIQPRPMPVRWAARAREASDQ